MKINERFYIGLHVFFVVLTIVGVSSEKEMAKGRTRTRSRSLKYLKDSINYLTNSPDARYEEKNLLKEHQKTVKNIESLLKSESENKDLVSKMEKELKKITADVERMKDSAKIRQKSRLSDECVDEIRRKNFQVAVKKFYYLNDITLLDSIASQVFNKSDKNFQLLLDFVNEIPSIILSFNMTKSIKTVVEKSKQFTPEKGLALMKNIKNNVIFQYSVDNDVKLEALDYIDEIKFPVKKWISLKLEKAAQENFRDPEATKICDEISEEMKDLKFLKDIGENVLNPNTNIAKFLFSIGDMKSIPKTVLAIQMYENVIKLGVNNYTILNLMKIQKTIDNSFGNESAQNKKRIEDVLVVPNLKQSVVEIFKRAIIQGYYYIGTTEDLSLKIFQNNEIFFKDVIEKTVEEIYGKKDTIEVIKIFRRNTKIGQSSIGYKAIFDIMGRRNHMDLISRNIGPLLKLENFVTETLGMPGVKYVEVNLVTQLKIIQFPLVDIKNNVLEILKSSLKSGNYSNEEHKNICLQIFAAETFQFFATQLSNLYGNENSDRLMDYFMAFPMVEERLVALATLQNKIPYNSDEFFKIASFMKTIRGGDEYNRMTQDFKLRWESSVRMLPSPVRFALFAKEVYIKSSKDSEYLDLSSTNGTRELYTLKNGKKGLASKWILESTHEPTVFKIKNSFYDEYLYATVDADSKRKVNSGNDFTTGHKWRFILTKGGVFIKNGFFKEYFHPEYKAIDVHKRFVYTWPSKTDLPIGYWIFQEVFHDPI